MSEFKFACPVCGQHLQAGMGYVGKPIKCPSCRTEFQVPDPRLTTSLRIEPERWVPPPTRAHGAPVSPTIKLPPAGPAPAPEPAPKPICRLAIVSVVLSLAGLLIGPPGSIAGIACGYAARSKIARNPDLSGAAWASAGIRLGYAVLALFVVVVIAVLAVLAWRAH